MQQIAAAAGEEASVFAPDMYVAVDEAAAGDVGAGVAEEPFRPARPAVKPNRHVEAELVSPRSFYRCRVSAGRSPQLLFSPS